MAEKAITNNQPKRGEKMDDSISFLVVLFYNARLLRCALKVKRKHITDDCAEFPMELENREKIHSLLPLHVRNCGPIVEVVNIFEITDLTDDRP